MGKTMSDAIDIWITKYATTTGKIIKAKGFRVPAVEGLYSVATGQFRGVQVNAYYVHESEQDAIKKMQQRIREYIADNERRNAQLLAIDLTADDTIVDQSGTTTSELKHAAE
jgi:hypothetical protein